MITALILAGGESRRMGEPKLLLRYRGETLLAHAVAKAKAVTEDVTVVVGAYPERYGTEARRLGVRVLENPDWSEGLASSLRSGVAATETAEACLVLLADQPFVTTEHLRALIERRHESGAPLVFSAYQGVLGAPTLIDQSLFGAVQTLRGDTGAKALAALAARVASVPLEAFADIDTPADRARLEP